MSMEPHAYDPYADPWKSERVRNSRRHAGWYSAWIDALAEHATALDVALPPGHEAGYAAVATTLEDPGWAIDIDHGTKVLGTLIDLGTALARSLRGLDGEDPRDDGHGLRDVEAPERAYAWCDGVDAFGGFWVTNAEHDQLRWARESGARVRFAQITSWSDGPFVPSVPSRYADILDRAREELHLRKQVGELTEALRTAIPMLLVGLDTIGSAVGRPTALLASRDAWTETGDGS